MKNTLAAAALILAALGFGQLASGQHHVATRSTVHASTVSPLDLGWGAPTVPTASPTPSN